MKHNIKVSPNERSRSWTVLEDETILCIEIPKGFVTDGASIPLGLRWLFPHGGAKFPPAVMHDYCYRTACVSKHTADLKFYKALLENGVSEIRAKLMFLAVYYCGFPSWEKYR